MEMYPSALQRRVIEGFLRCGSITQACARARVSRDLFVLWQRTNLSGFNVRLSEAVEALADALVERVLEDSLAGARRSRRTIKNGREVRRVDEFGDWRQTMQLIEGTSQLRKAFRMALTSSFAPDPPPGLTAEDAAVALAAIYEHRHRGQPLPDVESPRMKQRRLEQEQAK